MERLKRHDAYWKDNARYAALVDACRDVTEHRRGQGRPSVHPDRVIAVLVTMVRFARPEGVICDSTVKQLEALTRQSAQRIKDAMSVATTMGLIVTVDKALRPRPNARGQAPRRHLAYLIDDGALGRTDSPNDEMVRNDLGNEATVRTTDLDEMVRNDLGHGAPCRTPLMVTPLSEVASSSAATSAAKPRADDGAVYAAHDDRIADLRREVVIAYANRRGITTAAVRTDRRTMWAIDLVSATCPVNWRPGIDNLADDLAAKIDHVGSREMIALLQGRTA
jgi:hypothetical protein